MASRRTEKDLYVSEVNSSEIPDSPRKGSSIAEGPFDPQIEKRILRKLDFRLIPPLWCLFLISFVDRGNIGNAKIAGMDVELKLKGNMYNVAVFVFTIGYVVGAVPLNMAFKKYGPKSLAIMIFCWSMSVLGQGLTKSWEGLVACRLITGIAEAAFVPGCAYLIGSYYKRNEFLKRYVVFFSAGITAGAFNGLFSTLVSRMDGVGGYKGWRWIFIIEALITVVISGISYFTILPFPEDSTIFTPEEKAVLLGRLKADGGAVEHDDLTWKKALTYMSDWKIWLSVIIYIGAEENANSMVNFQPTILKGIGFTSNEAQARTIPVYVVALVFSIFFAWLSERVKHRYAFAMLGYAVLAVGLAVMIALPKRPHLRYMGLFFITSGAYLVMPLGVVWIAINVGKGYKRAVAMGAIVGFGNCGAFVASNVFITSETPGFHTGFSVGMVFCCVGAGAATLYFIGLLMSNKKRAQRRAELPAVLDEGSVEDLGEKHPDFRYSL